MPNRDKTGPRGEGPKTGRGLGPCEGEPQESRGFGRGRFCRCERGRRFQNREKQLKEENLQEE